MTQTGSIDVPRAVLEAERAILGSMLIGRPAVGVAMDLLSPDDFYREANRRVFDACCTVAARTGGAAVDMVTVAEELRSRGHMGDVGGMTYLSECQNAVATWEHAEHYARLVKEASLDRQIGRQLHVTAQDKTPENVSKLAELMASMSAVHRSALFDFRKDLPEAIERLLTVKPGDSLATGMPKLDRSLGHLKPGDVVTIGARTGVGKTALMARLAVMYARNGAAALYATTEMNESDMLTRILPMALRMDATQFRAQRFSAEDTATLRAEARGSLATLPLTILGRPRLAISDIRAAVNDARPAVVFVDYLQRCKFPKSDSFPQAITHFMAELKTFAQERRIVVFIGCQLSRTIDKTSTLPPSLADLKDSGGIEAESDVVGLLWKPTPELLLKRPKQVSAGNVGLDLIIAKHRHGQAGIVVEMELEARYVRMIDAQESDPEGQGELYS